jgi:hypothetical protein
MARLMDVVTQGVSGDARKQVDRQLGTNERGA